MDDSNNPVNRFKKTDLPPRGNRNADPLSNEAGAHPVEVGIGAALGGAATGVAAGALAGPVGAVVGAIAGAVGGGYAGKGVGESIDPTVEDQWLREYHAENDLDEPVDAYRPAYRQGVTAARVHPGNDFDDLEPSLRSAWEESQDDEQLGWEEARGAVKDGYSRAKTMKPSTPKRGDI